MNGPYTGTISLTAGTAYSFQANYFQVLTYAVCFISEIAVPCPIQTRCSRAVCRLWSMSGLGLSQPCTGSRRLDRIPTVITGIILTIGASKMLHSGPASSPLVVCCPAQSTGNQGFILSSATGTAALAPVPASYFTRTVPAPPPSPPSPSPPKPPAASITPSSASTTIESVKSGQVGLCWAPSRARVADSFHS